MHEQVDEFITDGHETSGDVAVESMAQLAVQDLIPAHIAAIEETIPTVELTEADQFYLERAAVRAANEARRAARLAGTGPRLSRHRKSADDSIGLYLNEIGEVPLLTAQQEKELSQKVQDGLAVRAALRSGRKIRASQLRVLNEAAAAKDLFIRSNLRLVVSIARRYPLPQGMTLTDLIQEGNLGLEHAVDKFEHQRGFKFSTYSTFWIRQSIGRALDQKGSIIRLPGEKSAQLRAAMRIANGDNNQLDETQGEIYRLTNPVSYDTPVGEDSEVHLGDLLPDNRFNPETEVIGRSEDQKLLEAIDSLGERTAYAIKQRFGLSDGEALSFREVGDELGITAEAARRLISRGITTLHGDYPELEELLERYQD